jgi:hypothetical protein
MINRYSEKQVSEGVISCSVSSYGYDLRVADEFKIFTNVNRTIVDPNHFDERSFVTVNAGRERHAIRAGVGRLRRARDLEHHAAAGEDLRQTNASAKFSSSSRTSLRDQLQGAQEKVPAAERDCVAEAAGRHSTLSRQLSAFSSIVGHSLVRPSTSAPRTMPRLSVRIPVERPCALQCERRRAPSRRLPRTGF